MKLYDILVTWIEWAGWDYVQKSRWERGIPAHSLTEASNVALARHTNRIYPFVSMGWPRWPEELI